MLPLTLDRITGSFWRPSEAFVDELATALQGKRVLEIFAGNGLLAGHLASRGIDITATTIFSGHDAHDLGLYFPVIESGAVDAVFNRGAEHDVLLICWPTTTGAVLDAVTAWGWGRDRKVEGDIVFVGEVTDYEKGYLGGCATDEFFEAIEFVKTFSTYRGNFMEKAGLCRLK
jgi:hypothetical protein